VVRLAPAARGEASAPPAPVVIAFGGDVGAALAGRLVQQLGQQGIAADAVDTAHVPGDVGTLVDLVALDAVGDGSEAMVGGLFRLQGVAASLKARQGRALLVANGGGHFLPQSAPSALGLSGLAKTARQEWPGVDVRFVDLAVDLDGALDGAARTLAAECLVAGAAEVGLSADQRLAPVVLPAPIGEASSRLVSGDVVVISGGARGVTATCALALARAVPGLKLAMLQRTVVDAPEPFFARDAHDEGALKRAILADAAARGASIPLREVAGMAQQILAAREVRATLAELRKNAQADVFACDVQSEASVAAALDAIRARFGAITVVVHGAGVLADKRIEDKTREQVARVVDTKVKGLLALIAQTAGDPLKALIAFSSVAGRFGNVGQVDYAMANEAMTRILAREKALRPQLLVKSLAWGPWEGGMVTPELKAQFASRGITVIERGDGARAFVRELSRAASDDVEIVLGASLAQVTGQQVLRPVEKTTRIAEAAMPWLADHAVKGEVVLPVVVAMDLMLQAATECGGGQHTVLRDVDVVKGQRLPRYGADGHTAVVTVTPTGGTARVELRVDGVLAYRASAVFGEASEAHAPAVSTLSPATFSQPLYAGSGGPGLLFHGPRFQLIEQLDGVNEHAMTARVVTTRAAGFDGTFASDVAALDAGLQLLLLWARHKTGGAFLPTRVGAFEQQHAAFVNGTLLCVLEAKTPLGRDDVRAVADVHYLDERGVPVFTMRDVVAHRLPDDAAFGTVGEVAITAPAGAAE
jgi:NAD(P)-dependent dehydrogenase (short-subunit alcohol dehydrogenase family)